MAISSSSEALVFLALRLPSRVIYYVFFSFYVFFFFIIRILLYRERASLRRKPQDRMQEGLQRTKSGKCFYPTDLARYVRESSRRRCPWRQRNDVIEIPIKEPGWAYIPPCHMCVSQFVQNGFYLILFHFFWFWFPRGVKSSRSRGMQSRWCLLAWRRERACVTSPVLPLGIFMSWSECVFFFRKNFIDLEICSVMFVCSPNVSYLHRSRDLFSYVRLFTECSIWSYCAMQAEITLRSKSF